MGHTNFIDDGVVTLRIIYTIQLMIKLDICIQAWDINQEVVGIGSQLAAIERGWA